MALPITLNIHQDSDASDANLLPEGLFKASAFHVPVDRENGNLYLNLIGIFDAPAAEQFTLKKNCTGFSRVFIDTDSLSRVHSLGRVALRRKLQVLSKPSFNFFILGDTVEQLAPDYAQIL